MHQGYWRGVAGIIFAAVVWGTTGTAATFAPEVAPLAIGAAAMGLGGLAQAAIALPAMSRVRRGLWDQKTSLILGAVAVAVYPLAFYASMRLAGVTVGTVVTIGSAPLISALIEFLVEGTRLTRRWVMGAALGLAGMVLITLAESSHAATGSNFLLGILLGLLGGATYALFTFTARQMMQTGLASRVAMGATFGLGGLLLMPVLLITGGALVESWTNAAVGLYMAIVPMFLGYLGFGYGLARVQASTATTITLFEPVVAALLAVVVVGERLAPAGWLGVVMVLTCLAVITARRD